MIHPQTTKLAKILSAYSVAVKSGDKVLINASLESSRPLAEAVYKQCLLTGAYPHLVYSTGFLDFFTYRHATDKQLTRKPEVGLFLANWADKFIRLFSGENNRQLASINPKKLMQVSKVHEPVKNIMLKKPWVLTEYPSQSMAQTAGMSFDELEKLYFKACLQDWPAIGKKLGGLKKKLDQSQKVEVIGPKTKLSLSFTGRFFSACDGHFNMPDGEVFGAPLETKTEGEVFFDLPSLRSGNLVEEVYLKFKKGKIVKAQAKKGQRYLDAVLKTDPGAKRLGEFAIGANYGIKKPMLNTLFDEKIGGTIHMALGSAYPDKEGGGANRSAVHWDLVKTMTSAGAAVLVNGRPVLKAGKLLTR